MLGWFRALMPREESFFELFTRHAQVEYAGDLFMGGSRDFLEGGHLFRIQLTGNRRKVAVDDPRLEDRVADNVGKWEITESESLLFGRNFGLVTDIHTGPDGHLYVLSNTRGAVYDDLPPPLSQANTDPARGHHRPRAGAAPAERGPDVAAGRRPPLGGNPMRKAHMHFASRSRRRGAFAVAAATGAVLLGPAGAPASHNVVEPISVAPDGAIGNDSSVAGDHLGDYGDMTPDGASSCSPPLPRTSSRAIPTASVTCSCATGGPA